MPKNTAKSHITPTTATQFQAVADGGIYGKVLGSSVVTLVTDTVPIAGGTWTPTFSGSTGLSGTPTLDWAVYRRIDSARVHISIGFNAALSGAGPARYSNFTLPIARTNGNFASTTEGGGVVTGYDGTNGLGGYLMSVAAGQTMRANLITATAAGTIYFRAEGFYAL